MTADLTRYINLRYGVDNEGNTVIGPQRPNASATLPPIRRADSIPVTSLERTSEFFPRSMPAAPVMASTASSSCHRRLGWTQASPGMTLQWRTSAHPAVNTLYC